MKSGWCMSRGASQHAACRISGCSCECHGGLTDKAETPKQRRMLGAKAGGVEPQ